MSVECVVRVENFAYVNVLVPDVAYLRDPLPLNGLTAWQHIQGEDKLTEWHEQLSMWTHGVLDISIEISDNRHRLQIVANHIASFCG